MLLLFRSGEKNLRHRLTRRTELKKYFLMNEKHKIFCPYQVLLAEQCIFANVGWTLGKLPESRESEEIRWIIWIPSISLIWRLFALLTIHHDDVVSLRKKMI